MSTRFNLAQRVLSLFIAVTFVTTSIITPQAQAQLTLPVVGTMVMPTDAFAPVIVRGVTVQPENPLSMNFLVDRGQDRMDGDDFRKESLKLVNYFLASLTVPESEMWVNLSPYEKDRVITDKFGQTEMGRDLLAQDYMLKQLSSSLTFPEESLGAEFWERVYSKVQEKYGSTEVPLNTFNKIWIIPEKAVVYEKNNTAFILESHLKVMLEEDYLSYKVAEQQSNKENGQKEDFVTRLQRAQASDVTLSLMRDIIIPEIEKEVNEGKTFANLRQIYHSNILATWFKRNLKESLLGQVYVDQNKTKGIEYDKSGNGQWAMGNGKANLETNSLSPITHNLSPQDIYEQYVAAFKQGVFDYIKEEYDSATEQIIPKKYFSGGAKFATGAVLEEINAAEPAMIAQMNNPAQIADVAIDLTTPDSAMMSQGGVLPRVNPTSTGEWNNLEQLAAEFQEDMKEGYLLRKFFEGDANLSERMNFGLGSVQYDLSRHLITTSVKDALLKLAHGIKLDECIKALFAGEKINETENRAVMHMALRNVTRDKETGDLVAADGPMLVDGVDVMPFVITELKKMESYVDKIHSGEWKGYSGKRIKHIVNIGIGGSDLGPRMAAKTLTPFNKSDVRVHFISNIDGTAAAEVMKKLDPKETVIHVVSKTFTTQETMQNAETLKKWVLDAYQGDEKAIAKHFVAVSTAKEKVSQFGIDTNNMFEFWDWVGGRFSMWSAVGLTLATYIGFDNFLKMLEGAHEADQHFRSTEWDKNIPVLKALLAIWYRNFLGATTFLVSPYDEYAGLLPKYLQQAFMESNGKRYDRDGKLVEYPTEFVFWGEAGTDGQHSYHQQRYQGTQLIPGDFIATRKSHNSLPGHHDKLFANFVAQIEAFAFGKTRDEVFHALRQDPKNKNITDEDLLWLAQQKTFPGDQPTTAIVMDQMTPQTFGNLIATYEHQIFVEGAIWNIFSYDQMGVELGKEEASKKTLPGLAGSVSMEKVRSMNLSPSAKNMIEEFRKTHEIDSAMMGLHQTEAGPDSAMFASQNGLSQKYLVGLQIDKIISDYIAHPFKSKKTMIDVIREELERSAELREIPQFVVSRARDEFIEIVLTPALQERADDKDEKARNHQVLEIFRNYLHQNIYSRLDHGMRTSFSFSDDLKKHVLLNQLGFQKGLPKGVQLNYLAPTSDTRPVKFGTSGDRGKIFLLDKDGQIIDDGDFDMNHVRRLAQGVALWFKENCPGQSILIGYDPRGKNLEFAKETASIFVANGIPVKIIESAPTPTPVLAFLASDDDNIGGVVNFTASHNPWQDGGFKFSPGHGGASPASVTDALTEAANGIDGYVFVDYESAKGVQDKIKITTISQEDAIQKYVLEYLIPGLKKMGVWNDLVVYIEENQDFTFIVDAMNGTGGPYLEALYAKMGKDARRPNFYKLIHEKSDPRFSDVHGEPRPDSPKSREGLKHEVMGYQLKALGALVDGDSDRFGHIDPNGEGISSNDFIAIYAHFRLEQIFRDFQAGNRDKNEETTLYIGKTVATSNFTNEVVNYWNERFRIKGIKARIVLHEEAVGFKYFVKRVTDENVEYIIAGEESAHAGIGEFMRSWDDGIVMGVLGLWIVAKKEMPLLDYKERVFEMINKKFLIATMNTEEQPGIKDIINKGIAIAQRELAEGKEPLELGIVKEVEQLCGRVGLLNMKVEEVITKDGLKFMLSDGENGMWILVRPSGTQNLVKVYVEAIGTYEMSLEKLQDFFKKGTAVGEKLIGGYPVDKPEWWQEEPADAAMNAKRKQLDYLYIQALDCWCQVAYFKEQGRTDVTLEMEMGVKTISIFGVDPILGNQDLLEARILQELGWSLTEEQNQLLKKYQGGDNEGLTHGGIDLDSSMMNLEIKRDGNGMPLPAFQQPIININVEGFVPVIINISPVANLFQVLGMVSEHGEEMPVASGLRPDPAQGDQDIDYGQSPADRKIVGNV